MIIKKPQITNHKPMLSYMEKKKNKNSAKVTEELKLKC